MKLVFVLIAAFASAGAVACARKQPVQLSDPVQVRLRALYSKQDAIFGGRYGGLEASEDIERGKQKLYRYGLPPEYEQKWSAILKRRFGVTVEFVADCEASPTVTNFVDAYNARVVKHIADRFGVAAYDNTREEAIREFESEKLQAANKALQPTPMSVTPPAAQESRQP